MTPFAQPTDAGTVTLQPDCDTGPVSRRQSRLDRQARVGILRNPNDPPHPPARRPTLMGRWPSLRSARRPRAEAVAQAAEQVVSVLTLGQTGPRPVVPVRRAADGSVQAIDIAGLMASVEGIGKPATPGRIGYGADVRPDGDPTPAAAPRRRKPSVLTREAWLDTGQGDTPDVPGRVARPAAADVAPLPAAPRSRRRITGLWIVGLGIGTALTVLIVLPAVAAL